MLACTALVGCTNENEPVVNNGNQVNGENADAYVSVKLIMTENGGSRAVSDGGYDKGEKYEQNIIIDKSIFLFYDNAGNYVTFGTLVGQVSEDNTTEGNHSHTYETTDAVDINSIYGKAFIALNGSDDDIKQINQVLTVVNYNNIADLKNKPLSYALTVTTNTTADNPNAGTALANETETGSGYLMTTSVYYDENNTNGDADNNGYVYTTKIDAEKDIFDTQAEALNAPVEIYIERAAAKMNLSYGENGSWVFDVEPESEDATGSTPVTGGNAVADNETADFVFNGELTPAKIEILGWSINNYNETSYIVKQLGTTWTNAETAPFTGWNNVKDYRSYWAKDTQWGYSGSTFTTTTDSEGNETMTVTNPTENDIKLKAVTFAQALSNKDTKDAAQYCFEHAVEATKDNISENRSYAVPYPNATTILIAAQIKPNGGEAVTLYKYSGIYYNAENYKALLGGYLSKYQKADGTAMSYTEEEGKTSDWTISIAEYTEGSAYTFSVTVELAEGVTLAEGTTIEAVQEDINSFYVANTQVFTNGYCYYQVPIEQYTSTSTESPIYGVIRNHWYKLIIDGVAHIGAPVTDPTQPLPEIPEKDIAYYLAARIHVLSWHVVEQNVTLE